MLKKGSPGRGEDGARPETFTYINPTFGLKHVFTAHVAAEPYWCKAHEHNERERGTKPCLNWMTDGAVPCQRCRPGVVPTDVCYVHLYREFDGKPVLVIVHDSAADLLAGVEYGVEVLCGRLEPKSSVFVKPAPNGKRMVTALPQRQRPIDIAVSLLNLWKIHALTEWYQRRGARADVARHRLSVPPPTTDVERLAIHSHQADNGRWDQAVMESVKRAEQRKREAERNGKHKPQEGGG